MMQQRSASEHERYMRMALDEARKAMIADEVPVGAVIECHGRIVGKGHNLTEALADVTAHAEMQAITDTARNLLIIISKLVTGRVKRVSRVPLSFSPAVTSIAG